MSKADSGERVAAAISVIKWTLITLAVLGAVVTVLGAALGGGSVPYASVVVLITVAATTVWCLMVWVLFGWFEHTLLALVAIARNTSGGTVAAPPPLRQMT